MIITKLGWLIMETLLLGYFLYFGSSPAMALFIALLLIPIVSIPISMTVGKRIKIEVNTDLNLKKGHEGNISLIVYNPTMIAVPWASCKIVIDNQLNLEKQTILLLTWLPPKKSQELTLKAGSNYAGRLKVRVEKVKIYDCFGLIGVGSKLDASAHMTVQPDTFEMAITLIPNIHSNDESDLYSQDRIGNDLSETFQIRDYVPGDNPRQIHWKLASKFDRLIVRDPSLPIIQNVLVFWERTGESTDLDAIDAQAEIIVSICKSLVDLSIQFTIGWNDTDRNLVILHEIKGMDDLIGIIPRLMRATGRKEGMSGAELMIQTSSHAMCGHMVYLTQKPQFGVEEMCRYGHVTMISSEVANITDTKIYDSKHYKEQLTQIEI